MKRLHFLIGLGPCPSGYTAPPEVPNHATIRTRMTLPSHIRISVPTDTSPELELMVLRLTEALADEGMHREIERSGEAANGVVSGSISSAARDARSFSITLSEDAFMAVEIDDAPAVALPLAIPRQQFRDRDEGGILRILFAGAGTFDRRLKMTARAIVEIRRRRRPVVLLAAGELPSEIIRLAPPDHYFSQLDGEELQSLLFSCDAVADCVDADGCRTPLGWLAESAGIPVIAHRDARGDAAIRVEDWSADAFCDAMTTVPRTRSDSSVPPFPETLRHFNEALGLGTD